MRLLTSFLFLASILVVCTEAGFRCSIGEWACKASCVVTLQDSGNCRDDGECICNEEDLDIEGRISEVLGGQSLREWIEDKLRFFSEQVEGLDIAEDIKKIVPSRCQISDRFCRDSCYGIGKINGTCNAEKTDCTCHEESVSPRQYALCIEDGFCRYFCQQKGYATGDCQGTTGWDCQCMSLKDDGEFDKLVMAENELVDYDITPRSGGIGEDV